MSILGRRKQQKGDTIIEVLFATAVFSMIAIGGMSAMNRGTTTAQRSLELTLVRQQISAQASALRYVHHAYVTSYGTSTAETGVAAEWSNVTAKADTAKASDFSSGGQHCPGIPSRAFVMNARTAKVHTGPIASMGDLSSNPRPYSQLVYEGDEDGTLSDAPGVMLTEVDGIWMEAVRSPADGGNNRFIDFHIRACWISPGGGVPATLGTIVRLYEPI